MVKKWIRGNKERGFEVIKMLENLGGIAKPWMKGNEEGSIYLIHPEDNYIYSKDALDLDTTAIMWAGKELKLPEQKSEPKFKIGDKVIFTGGTTDKYTIIKLLDNDPINGCFRYKVGSSYDDVCTINCFETDLQSANTLKRFDPVMISDNAYDWICGFYSGDERVSAALHTNKTQDTHNHWKYIVPLSDFDFNDLKSNIKKSVV